MLCDSSRSQSSLVIAVSSSMIDDRLIGAGEPAPDCLAAPMSSWMTPCTCRASTLLKASLMVFFFTWMRRMECLEVSDTEILEISRILMSSFVLWPNTLAWKQTRFLVMYSRPFLDTTRSRLALNTLMRISPFCLKRALNTASERSAASSSSLARFMASSMSIILVDLLLPGRVLSSCGDWSEEISISSEDKRTPMFVKNFCARFGSVKNTAFRKGTSIWATFAPARPSTTMEALAMPKLPSRLISPNTVPGCVISATTIGDPDGDAFSTSSLPSMRR
mmetsp:Transcript_1565/g.5517  ORF Transcript_1565/g.5517 Transcript_1565/m.5517 type:complete len:278 (+) Transcript_1565:472-1305(+)